MSRAVGDLIKDNRRRTRAVQFPVGWLEPNARAPVERHEVAAVRPPAVRTADAGVDALEDFLNNYASTDMEKTLCKTGCKDFLTQLYAGLVRMCRLSSAAGRGHGS